MTKKARKILRRKHLISIQSKTTLNSS
jgi:hypothetical protein